MNKGISLLLYLVFGWLPTNSLIFFSYEEEVCVCVLKDRYCFYKSEVFFSFEQEHLNLQTSIVILLRC